MTMTWRGPAGAGVLALDRAEDQDLGAVEVRVDRDAVLGEGGHDLLGPGGEGEGEEEEGEPQHQWILAGARE